jgi:hypothetical protein
MSRHRSALLSAVGVRCLVLASGLAAVSASAQVSISLKAEHRHYLRYEPVDVIVILRNYSGNTLTFSADEGPARGYLHFLIEDPNGKELRCTDASFNPVDDLVLGAGATKQLRLSLNRAFGMQREGTYTISAQIGHARLPNDYRCEPLSIDVREGLPVITRNVGLPTGSAAAAIKGITVSLLLFHDGERELYCLRAEDDKAVYGTVRLGPKIAGSRPQMDADAASDIHVLVQVQPRLFIYAVYVLSETGVRLRQRQFLKPDESGPRLTRAPGYLKIAGGVPAREGVDVKLEPGP